jgi:hypothetical protein
MPVVICPKCSRRLKAPDEAFGKKLQCTACGHVFAIGLGEPARATHAETIHAIFTSKHGPRGLIFAGTAAVLLVCVCALGIAIGLGLQRPTTPTERSGEVMASGASQHAESAPGRATSEKKQEAEAKASPPSSMQRRLERFKLASEIYEREQVKWMKLIQDCIQQKAAIARQLFVANLPKNMNVDGLKIRDVLDGASSVAFDNLKGNGPSDLENLEAVRGYADEFAKECNRADSKLAKQLNDEVEKLECEREKAKRARLMNRLQRERDEAEQTLNK